MLYRNLTGSVGAGGLNHPREVEFIQGLLNVYQPHEGGPAPKLMVDGDCGPKTIAAIKAFQQFHFKFGDGRVDPNGKTKNKLYERTRLLPLSGIDYASYVFYDAGKAHEWHKAAVGAIIQLRGGTPLPGLPPAKVVKEALKRHFFFDDENSPFLAEITKNFTAITPVLTDDKSRIFDITFKEAKKVQRQTKMASVDALFPAAGGKIALTPRYYRFKDETVTEEWGWGKGWGDNARASLLLMGAVWTSNPELAMIKEFDVLHMQNRGETPQQAVRHPARYSYFAQEMALRFNAEYGPSKRNL